MALGTMAAAGLAAGASPPASAALVPVPARTAYEVNRIDSPTAAALPDGRVLLGWTNGTNSGDTTLAMVRPAGGLLPATPQVLRTGYSGEDLRFTTGGPAADPVITSWEDGDSRTPFRVKLDGDRFTTQTAIFSGTYGTGRFPRYARCPDGTGVFAYQFTNISPPAPTSYSSSARLTNADGSFVGGSTGTASAPDYYQDPTVTCDRGVPLFSTAVAGDDNQGSVLPEHLRVVQLGAGGGTLLNTDTVAPHAYASAPDARVAPDGRVFILWTESPVNPASAPKTYLATRAPGATGPATFSTVPFFSAPDSYPGDLFFDAAGNTHVIIEHAAAMGSASYGIRTAAPGSATFGPEQPLLPSGNHYIRLLTDHPDGNPRLLVISSDAAPPYTQHYALQGIPQAGSGDATVPIQADGLKSATATFLPGGDLFLAGVRELDATHEQLVESGLDSGLPPTLDHVVVPGLAAAGETVGIAIDARDAMGLAEFRWTVSGGALPAPLTLTDQHATIPGLAPGTYEVRARAVDRAGNATELSRTMRVLDPNAVTPGSQAFAEAVAAAGGTLAPPVIDRAAPKLSKVSATRGRKGASRRTVTVRLTVNEPSALNTELTGTLRRGKERGTLVLRSTTIRSLRAGRATKTTLTIPTKLSRLVRGRLRVRLVVTDASGNQTTKSVSVGVAKR